MTPIELMLMLVIILGLIVVSFVAGLRLAGYYHRNAAMEREHALKQQYMRLMVGADADDPVKPYVSTTPTVLPPEFEERMRSTGRATAAIKTTP